jgi:hypothetical protein
VFQLRKNYHVTMAAMVVQDVTSVSSRNGRWEVPQWPLCYL